MSPLKEKNDEDAEIAEKYVKTKDKCIVNFYPNNQKKFEKKRLKKNSFIFENFGEKFRKSLDLVDW